MLDKWSNSLRYIELVGFILFLANHLERLIMRGRQRNYRYEKTTTNKQGLDLKNPIKKEVNSKV